MNLINQTQQSAEECKTRPTSEEVTACTSELQQTFEATKAEILSRPETVFNSEQQVFEAVKQVLKDFSDANENFLFEKFIIVERNRNYKDWYGKQKVTASYDLHCR